jgi:hypothetical protein
MSVRPSFASTPARVSAVLSAANTNRDGTGTVVTILTAVSAGTKITQIELTAGGTTASGGAVRLFLYDGSNYRLWREVIVPAVTPSASSGIPVWTTTILTPNLVLKSGYSLRGSTEKADTINVHVAAADLT